MWNTLIRRIKKPSLSYQGPQNRQLKNKQITENSLHSREMWRTAKTNGLARIAQSTSPFFCVTPSKWYSKRTYLPTPARPSMTQNHLLSEGSFKCKLHRESSIQYKFAAFTTLEWSLNVSSPYNIEESIEGHRTFNELYREDALQKFQRYSNSQKYLSVFLFFLKC